ncbi:MAG: DUF362 domain-containing protein [Isosphaeraceae bacterium]
MTSHSCTELSRRKLFKASLLGGAALAVGKPMPTLASAAPAGARGERAPSRVAITSSDDRADLVFQGLNHLKAEIARAIGDRLVVIKPNNVATDRALSATTAGCLEGVLEFLKSIGKLPSAIVAESAGMGPTPEGFAHYGYEPLAAKYGVKLVDLDREPTAVVHALDQNDMRPHAVRASRLLLDRRNSFVISLAKLKTHDLVVATLSLKNIVVGAPIKDQGFRWGPGARRGARTDKRLIHGSGFHGTHYNLYALAPRLHPDLSVIDGYQGMEGNGPVYGTPVEHRVAVTSLDWLAADRVGVALMGINMAHMGYLNYCGAAGMGEIDLSKIQILGEKLQDHVRSYRLADNIDQQLQWMKPLRG